MNDLAALTATYLERAREIVTSEFAQLLVDIDAAAQSFVQLFTSPGGFQSQLAYSIRETV